MMRTLRWGCGEFSAAVEFASARTMSEGWTDRHRDGGVEHDAARARQLKTDRGFVKDLEDSDDARAVVADGVGNAAQRVILIGVYCAVIASGASPDPA
ncbi:MAG: hypothetical protein ACRYGA_11475 [Janthinobacterium lividum]